jgi:hypothetical protein
MVNKGKESRKGSKDSQSSSKDSAAKKSAKPAAEPSPEKVEQGVQSIEDVVKGLRVLKKTITPDFGKGMDQVIGLLNAAVTYGNEVELYREFVKVAHAYAVERKGAVAAADSQRFGPSKWLNKVPYQRVLTDIVKLVKEGKASDADTEKLAAFMHGAKVYANIRKNPGRIVAAAKDDEKYDALVKSTMYQPEAEDGKKAPKPVKTFATEYVKDAVEDAKKHIAAEKRKEKEAEKRKAGLVKLADLIGAAKKGLEKYKTSGSGLYEAPKEAPKK